MEPDSASDELSNYSFLVVFANDDTISQAELQMIEKLALRDNVIDDDERRVLRSIFDRANTETMDQATKDEIADFRARHDI